MKLIEAVFWSKLAIKGILGLFLVIILGYYSYKTFIYRPPAPAEIFIPDYGCGPLPEANFPSLHININDLTPEIVATQTVKIKVPPIAYVYKIPTTGETFSTKTKAKQLADILEFRADAFTKPNPITLKWEDSALKRKLLINTSDFSFVYSYLYSAYPKIPNKKIPAPAIAPSIAQQILSSLGLMTQDLIHSRLKTYPVQFTSEDRMQVVDALLNAQAIRIDFQRPITVLKYPKFILSTRPEKRIDFTRFSNLSTEDPKTQVFQAYTVTTTPYTGNIRSYIKSNSTNPIKGLLRLEYKHFRIDNIPCGTYPIIKPDTAITYIKQNKANVVAVVNKKDKLNNLDPIPPIDRIIITQIELAYYEPYKPGGFLEPVYVVTGDIQFSDKQQGEVVFYVPAIEKRSK